MRNCVTYLLPIFCGLALSGHVWWAKNEENASKSPKTPY